MSSLSYMNIPKLSKDVSDFLSLLNKYSVRYLVIGGWAVALHGKPRYTKDIDILVAKDLSNANKIMAVLDEFGFSSLNLTIDDFLKDNYVIQLGFEPNRIDILTGVGKLDFNELENRKECRLIDNINLSLISVSDLIETKRIAARPQDIADISTLEKLTKQISNIKRM